METMTRKLDEIASEALQMNVERMWSDEAARRYRQLKAGTATSIATKEVFARLDARARR
jgi:hypothetical protein